MPKKLTPKKSTPVEGKESKTEYKESKTTESKIRCYDELTKKEKDKYKGTIMNKRLISNLDFEAQLSILKRLPLPPKELRKLVAKYKLDHDLP